MVDNLTYDDFWPLYVNENRSVEQQLRYKHYMKNGWWCILRASMARVTFAAYKGKDVAAIPFEQNRYNIPYDKEVHNNTIHIKDNYTPDFDIITLPTYDQEICRNYNNIDDEETGDFHKIRRDREDNVSDVEFYSDYITRKLNGIVHKNICYPLSYYQYTDYRYIKGVDRLVQGSRQDYLNFPFNITRVIAMKKSKRGGDRWLLLGVISHNKYFFYHARCLKDGFDSAGTIKLYICNDYNTIVNYTIDELDKYKLGLKLTIKEETLAKLVYYKFIQLMSKPPHGYYFLKDMQKHLHTCNSPDYEQFKIWCQQYDYEKIKSYLLR